MKLPNWKVLQSEKVGDGLQAQLNFEVRGPEGEKRLSLNATGLVLVETSESRGNKGK